MFALKTKAQICNNYSSAGHGAFSPKVNPLPDGIVFILRFCFSKTIVIISPPRHLILHGCKIILNPPAAPRRSSSLEHLLVSPLWTSFARLWRSNCTLVAPRSALRSTSLNNTIISRYFLISWLSLFNCAAGQGGMVRRLSCHTRRNRLHSIWPILSSLVIYFACCVILPSVFFPQQRENTTEDLISNLRSVTNRPSLRIVALERRFCFHSDDTWLKKMNKQRRNGALLFIVMGDIFNRFYRFSQRFYTNCVTFSGTFQTDPGTVFYAGLLGFLIAEVIIRKLCRLAS